MFSFDIKLFKRNTFLSFCQYSVNESATEQFNMNERKINTINQTGHLILKRLTVEV